MALTLRNDAKQEIIKLLREQGYATYARLVSLFDIYLTDDPKVIGYMIPGKAKIVLNKNLLLEQVSTIIRHEILHEFLTHMQRHKEFIKAHPELHADIDPENFFNIAADFEISNKGYTEADKKIAKNISLDGQILRGLVTEYDRPEWVTLSFEEMLERLLNERSLNPDELKSLLDRAKTVSQKDLDDLSDELDDVQSSSSDKNSEVSDNDPSDKTGSSSKSDEDSSASPNSSSSTGNEEELSKDVDQAKDEISEIKDELKDIEKDDGKVFPTKEEADELADIQARVDRIREFLDDIKNKDSAFSEVTYAKQIERAKKNAIAVRNSSNYMISRFRNDITRFINDQIGRDVIDSYARIHPSYEDSEFIVPGRKESDEISIPLINVYHDVSGSFSDPAKTATAMQVVGSLSALEKQGLIEIDVYYFADKVSTDKNKAGGGTEGAPVLEHILKTKPTNVVIITDGDIHDCTTSVKVPGGVWMLFYGERSANLISHLSGKKTTNYYDIYQ